MTATAGPAPWDKYWTPVDSFHGKSGGYTSKKSSGNLAWDLSTGWHVRRQRGWIKAGKKAGTLRKHTITLSTGDKVAVYKADDYDDYIGFHATGDYSSNEEIREAVETAFAKDASVKDAFAKEEQGYIKTEEGCGHIKLLEYSVRAQMLRVTFENGSVCIYFRVPYAVAGELLYHAETKSTVIGRRGDTRHLLGKVFWDYVRIRGQIHGARYPWDYQSNKNSSKYEGYGTKEDIKAGKRDKEIFDAYKEANKSKKAYDFTKFKGESNKDAIRHATSIDAVVNTKRGEYLEYLDEFEAINESIDRERLINETAGDLGAKMNDLYDRFLTPAGAKEYKRLLEKLNGAEELINKERQEALDKAYEAFPANDTVLQNTIMNKLKSNVSKGKYGEERAEDIARYFNADTPEREADEIVEKFQKAFRYQTEIKERNEKTGKLEGTGRYAWYTPTTGEVKDRLQSLYRRAEMQTAEQYSALPDEWRDLTDDRILNWADTVTSLADKRYTNQPLTYQAKQITEGRAKWSQVLTDEELRRLRSLQQQLDKGVNRYKNKLNEYENGLKKGKKWTTKELEDFKDNLYKGDAYPNNISRDDYTVYSSLIDNQNWYSALNFLKSHKPKGAETNYATSDDWLSLTTEEKEVKK